MWDVGLQSQRSGDLRRLGAGGCSSECYNWVLEPLQIRTGSQIINIQCGVKFWIVKQGNFKKYFAIGKIWIEIKDASLIATSKYMTVLKKQCFLFLKIHVLFTCVKNSILREINMLISSSSEVSPCLNKCLLHMSEILHDLTSINYLSLGMA